MDISYQLLSKPAKVVVPVNSAIRAISLLALVDKKNPDILDGTNNFPCLRNKIIYNTALDVILSEHASEDWKIYMDDLYLQVCLWESNRKSGSYTYEDYMSDQNIMRIIDDLYD